MVTFHFYLVLWLEVIHWYIYIVMIYCNSASFSLEDIQCEVKMDRVYLGTNKLATVYVVHHDDASYEKARELAKKSNVYHPIHIPTTRYFESVIFTPAVFALLQLESEYTGFITYKYKTESHNVDIVRIIGENPGYDLYALVPHSMKLVDEPWHPPPFQKNMKLLFSRLGMDVDDVMQAPVFYRNYWVARTPIVKAYATFMTKAIKIIESDPVIKKAFLGNAHYGGGQLKPEFLEQLTGMPYYTMHPFILERLICAYTRHRRLRVFYVTQ